jgi:hypothetical protein
MARRRIGTVGVDAGIVWIGDPCYIIHPNTGRLPEEVGKDWDDFCKILETKIDKDGCAQFSYDKGHAGLGVVVPSGYGDGTYPVYATFNADGRVMSVTVRFC